MYVPPWLGLEMSSGSPCARDANGGRLPNLSALPEALPCLYSGAAVGCVRRGKDIDWLGRVSDLSRMIPRVLIFCGYLGYADLYNPGRELSTVR